MGDSARLRVDHEQRGEGDEIEHVPASAANDQRGHEQNGQVAVRRQPEAEEPDGESEGRDQTGRSEQRRSSIEILARWAPLLSGLAACLAALVRLPFWNAPLTADE